MQEVESGIAAGAVPRSLVPVGPPPASHFVDQEPRDEPVMHRIAQSGYIRVQ
jgi:hypothetical protein